LSNNLRLSQVAGERCAWPLAATSPGTSLPAAVSVPLAGTGVFAGPRRKPHHGAQTAAPQTTSKNYQEMTRIAANGGGQSGSHPAWDPV
jgi:hypothetical protein